MHYADKNFRALETVANAELRKRYDWYKFTSNKLTLRTPSSLLAEVSQYSRYKSGHVRNLSS